MSKGKTKAVTLSLTEQEEKDLIKISENFRYTIFAKYLTLMELK